MQEQQQKLEVVQGDIAWDRGMLVIPVNCIPGVMGAGLAKQFADNNPKARKMHEHLLRFSGLRVEKPTICYAVAPMPVVFFPTKNHWKDPSKFIWIDRGLTRLGDIIQNIEECPWHRYVGGHTSESMKAAGIAMPALGCGLGGLHWEDVRDAVERFSDSLPDGWHVRLYRPHNPSE